MERALGQAQPPLGSRVAVGAVHARVLGIDEHHLTTRSHGGLDQHRLQGRDRAISGFARHRGPRQERRPEVLDGDSAVSAYNAVRPLPGAVEALTLHVLVSPCSVALG